MFFPQNFPAPDFGLNYEWFQAPSFNNPKSSSPAPAIDAENPKS